MDRTFWSNTSGKGRNDPEIPNLRIVRQTNSHWKSSLDTYGEPKELLEKNPPQQMQCIPLYLKYLSKFTLWLAVCLWDVLQMSKFLGCIEFCALYCAGSQDNLPVFSFSHKHHVPTCSSASLACGTAYSPLWWALSIIPKTEMVFYSDSTGRVN